MAAHRVRRPDGGDVPEDGVISQSPGYLALRLASEPVLFAGSS